MPQIFGENLTKAQLRERIGDITQVAGATLFTYADGKAAGSRGVEVKTGSGLRFVISPDRGMDITYAEYKGVPLSYISKTGSVAPTHYDEADFLRSFTAGLLTTCGLTYMGAPCVDEGVSLGLHGRIGNTPATDLSIRQEWVGEDYVIAVSGKVRESTVFGENLVLTRTVTAKLGENRLSIHDRVENEGFATTPFMMLYHMNFGYPLVSADTRLETNGTNLRPRDAVAAPGLSQAAVFSDPVPGYAEQCFYRDAAGASYAALVNPRLGLTARVKFNGCQLPYLVEWKQMGQQDYVVGLEPGTNTPEGRAHARANGTLQFLAPGEIKEHDVAFVVEEN